MRSSIDFHRLVASIGDGVIAADANGAITLWNPGAERIFGWTEDEALGQSLDIIVPERLRARHWAGYESAMRTGTTKYGSDLLRVPAVRKDGTPMSIAFTVAMLFGADGKVAHVVAVIRDETGRYADERALRKRIAELEARLSSPSP